MTTPEGRQFQIEIEVGERDHQRVQSGIEDWLTEWRMPANLLASSFGGKFLIRAAFKEERHARAFELKYGGRRISDDELVAAIADDAHHEDLFEQLARDYPD